ncbi:MAG: YcaO-like family protein [Desulfatirhabdiaceae bacterium]
MRQPVVLKDAFKGFTLDQDKIISPEETVRRLKTRLGSLNLDILEKTVRIDSGRLDIPVFFSYCGKDALAMTGTRKQMGKGATPEQSEASAVMELAERFSFFSFCNTPSNFISGCHHQFKDHAIPFETISQSVHDTSDDIEGTRIFYEQLPMRWTWGFNLTENRNVLVPFDWFYSINEYNGPSAGNCVEEALIQGICEIVERHVSSLVSRDRIAVPGIQPASASNPLVLDMLQKYNKTGINLYLSDFTLGMGIPTVGILAWDPATYPDSSEIVWTAGTTPNPDKALSRALTEVAQLAGDFNSKSCYEASGLPKFTRLQDAEYIMKPQTRIDLSQLPDISHDNMRIEVENCIQALKRNHMDVFVIDTLHSGLQIPAFYTIVPGAHFRERAAGTSVGMFAAKLATQNLPPHQAMKRLMEMDRLFPGKYYTHFYMGQMLISLERFDDALSRFDSALRLNPNPQDIPSIYSYMGVSLKETGRYRDALDILGKGLRLDSERTDILNLMGFCHFKLKDHETAIQYFEKVIDLNPGSAIDYANIAVNYREMDQLAKAIHYFELALSLDPGIEFARENLMKLTNLV